MSHFEKPTDEQVKYIHSQLRGPEATKYFFDRLENPLWIPGLRQLGWFDSPPVAERDAETQAVYNPDWPPLRYLVRMATECPTEVFDILSKLPETDNLSVRIEIVNAALKLPGEYAAQLAECKVKAWLVENHISWFWGGEQFPKLVEHLALCHEPASAFSFADALLDIHKTDRLGASAPEDQAYRLSPEAKGLVDDTIYREWLNRCVAALRETDESGVVDLLVRLLIKANECSFWPDRSDFPDDHSYVWRPAIEDHEQNWGHDLRDLLVEVLRDTIVDISQRCPARVRSLVGRLEGGEWTVLKRLVLHLLRLHLKPCLDLASERVLNKVNFDDVGMRHEYSALLRDVFNLLSSEQQMVILGWIDVGPRIDHLKQGHSFFTGEPFTPEQIDQYVSVWKRDRLATLSDLLQGEWRTKYEGLVQECGEPEHPEFPSYHWGSGPFGPSSPYTADQLYEMPHDELLKVLKGFLGNPNDPFERQRDLAMALRTAIAIHPDHFSLKLNDLRLIPKVHICFIVGGFEQAVRDGKPIDWLPILDYCAWVVSLEESEFEGAPKENPQHLRSNARGEVADLVGQGLIGDRIPVEMRDQVWALLEPLTSDRLEPASAVSINDPYSYAINCTPGKALNAVVRYALWVYRTFDHPADDSFATTLGEVGRVLQKYLYPNANAHPVTHAVLGQWLPWLILMDVKWTRISLSGILPFDDGGQLLKTAAWRTYIMYDSAYSDVFQFLSREYAAAVDTLPPKEDLTQHDGYGTNLIDHVVIFYLRGLIELQDPEGCIQRLYRKRRSDLNAQAISFIGQSLSRSKEPWAPEPLRRAKDLWQYRLAEAEQAENKKDYAREIAAFGWWYESKQLEPEWATSQLVSAVRIAGFIEDEYSVFQRISELAKSQPGLALDGLRAIVENDKRGWYGYMILSVGGEVVRQVSKSGVITQYDKAAQLIETLCAKGFVEARSWMQPL